MILNLSLYIKFKNYYENVFHESNIFFLISTLKAFRGRNFAVLLG